jgi:hypothetical protein
MKTRERAPQAQWRLRLQRSYRELKLKRPSKDANVTAFVVPPKATSQSKTPPDIVMPALGNPDMGKQLERKMGRRGGQNGSAAHAASLSKRQRSEIARAAAQKRRKTPK